MKLTRRGWLRSLALVAGCVVAMWLAGMAAARAQAVSTTAVQGTVYLANGQPAAGTLVVSWPTFTTAAGQLISAGQTSVTVGADGFVSVNLAPNQGATPAGEYYTAVFYKSDGTVSTQYWVVPAAAQATLAQVQAQVMPAAQAVQAVSKAYVDQSVAQALSSQLLSSGGNLTGPLYLNGDPSQPLQAADKHYVDSSFSAALPLSGGTITGPASFNAAVTFGSSVTASSGIGFTGTAAAQTLGNLIPGVASDGANGMTLAGNLKSSSVNGVWDLKSKFGAIGSNKTMTCTAAANSYTLSGCSGGDFVAGEYVYLPFAGASPTISAPAAPTAGCASDNGASCTGSTQYCYEIAAVQSGYFAGPITAVSSPTCVTQATQTPYGSSADIYTTVTWVVPSGAQGVLVYKSINGGPYNFYLSTVPSGQATWNDHNDAPSAQFTCTDMGYPCTAPSSSVASGVWSQIASVSGSIVTLQARTSGQPAYSDPSKPGVSGTVTVGHDDTPAFMALDTALIANQGGGLVKVHIGQGNYVVYPYNTSSTQTGKQSVLFLSGMNNVTFSGDGREVTNIDVDNSFGDFIQGECGFGDPAHCTSMPWPPGSSGAGYAINDPALVGGSSITLSSLSNLSNFAVGDYVVIFDTTSSYPANDYSEINKVLAINSTTGTLTLAYPLTKTYSASLPAPYSSCAACSGTPKVYVVGNGLVATNITFENMSIRGPVLFGAITGEDGLTIRNDDIEVQNFLILNRMRHVKIIDNSIIEDPWGTNYPWGMLMSAGGSTDEVAEGNTYTSVHFLDTGRQECSEGGANISDMDNRMTFGGISDPFPGVNTDEPLFWEPLCFNYTLSGNTVTAQYPVGGIFGGDGGYGGSGVMKDNSFSISNSAYGAIGAFIGDHSFSSPYIVLDKNKFITPSGTNTGATTANANYVAGSYATTTLNGVTGNVSFYNYYGQTNMYVLKLAAGGSLGALQLINHQSQYKFTLFLVQPSTGTVSNFGQSPCTGAFWNLSNSAVDCSNLPTPVMPTANGGVLILNYYDDGTVLHYLGSNAAQTQFATNQTVTGYTGAFGSYWCNDQMTTFDVAGNLSNMNFGFHDCGSPALVGLSFVQPATGGPYTLPATCASGEWKLQYGGTFNFQGGVCPAMDPAAGSTTTIWFYDDGTNVHEISRSYWAPGTGLDAGTVNPSPQFQPSYYDQSGSQAHVKGDIGAATDGAGNWTFKSVTVGTSNPSSFGPNGAIWADSGSIGSGSAMARLGYDALASQTTGYSNTAVGYESLNALTTGTWDVALGDRAMQYANVLGGTTALSSVAAGSSALGSDLDGQYDTGFGTNALFSLTTGYSNDASGKDSAWSESTGYQNTAHGVNALTCNNGHDNVAEGYRAIFGLTSNPDGLENVTVGNSGGAGYLVGDVLTVVQSGGSGGTVTVLSVGNGGVVAAVSQVTLPGAGYSVANNLSTTGGTGSGATVDITALQGPQGCPPALDQGYFNAAVGSHAMEDNDGGTQNVAIGAYALQANSTASSNTAVGVNSLVNQTTGGANTAVGENSCTNITTGTYNTCVGVSSNIYGAATTDAVAIGPNTSPGGNSVAVGFDALQHNTTVDNVAVGAFSLQAETTGASNAALGINALNSDTTGYQNTAVGSGSCGNTVTGAFNTCIGNSAGPSGDFNNTITIGYQSSASNPGEADLGSAANTSTTHLFGAVNIGGSSPALQLAGSTIIPTGSTLPYVGRVASGTVSLGTAAIASGACATAVTATATGALTTDTIQADFNSDPSAIAGYGVSGSGAVLTIYKWVSVNQVNFKVCNNTPASITPAAATLNWNVTR